MTDVTDDVIALRAGTHGDFTDTSACAQRLKSDIRAWVISWETMKPYQREALDLILQKIARIMVGNPMEPDHWLDIAGYATMVYDRLPKPAIVADCDNPLMEERRNWDGTSSKNAAIGTPSPTAGVLGGLKL